jgi:hypothetical protein
MQGIHSFMHSRTAPRSGTVLVIVIWTIAVAGIVLCSVQLTAQRQAMLGRETLQQVQARWAARSGMEATIATMADYTIRPEPGDAFALPRAMELVASGEVHHATWDIRHHKEGYDIAGPFDEHSKFNINLDQRSLLIDALDGMSIDIIAELADWVDQDDEVSPFGAERDFYLSSDPPYEPRNGPFRNTAELELVAGIWPERLRGEDWNLNYRLDPNEDDADLTFPDDDANNAIDDGWYRDITVYSTEASATESGYRKAFLPRTPLSLFREQMEGVLNEEEARAVLNYGRNEGTRLEQLVSPFLEGGSSAGGSGGATGDTGTEAGNDVLSTLSLDQIAAILNEATTYDPRDRQPGRMNINTVSARLLRELFPEDQTLVEEILYLRSQPQGIPNMVTLARQMNDLDAGTWDTLTTLFTTSSAVYTISSRGRSVASGLEVEIIAVVDRSTVPIRIIEYREQ